MLAGVSEEGRVWEDVRECYFHDVGGSWRAIMLDVVFEAASGFLV